MYMYGWQISSAMKPTAYLINIGRGITVDLAALTRALQDYRIAGAGLDVFPPGLEPLPSEHPLASFAQKRGR